MPHRKLARRVGRRGACLLLFGLIMLVYGYAFAIVPLSPAARAALAVPLQIASQTTWGAAWMAAGGLAIAASPLRPGRDGIGFVPLIGMSALWSLSYFAAQALGVPRAALGGLIWAAMVTLLLVIAGWPEVDRR